MSPANFLLYSDNRTWIHFPHKAVCCANGQAIRSPFKTTSIVFDWQICILKIMFSLRLLFSAVLLYLSSLASLLTVGVHTHESNTLALLVVFLTKLSFLKPFIY